MKRPMTPVGYAALRVELMRLKSSRPELAKAIEVARALGDISENADYDAAKEKSGMTEAKIRDLEAKLSNAEVIDPRALKDPTRVVFGTSVRVADVDSGDEKVFSIVGADESNVAKGFISFEAPIGRALIGKEVGDIARMELPGGTKEFEILDIFVEPEKFEIQP